MTTAAKPLKAATPPPPIAANAPAAAPPATTFDYAPGVVMMSGAGGAPVEAIRALRTHISAQHLQEGRRALALCGASEGVGCTFVAANLAVAFAQAGVKTMLIDADMRRPSVDTFVIPSRSPEGLAQYLASDDLDVSSYIQAEVQPDLSVIFAGGGAPNPQELLSGARFKDLIDFCLREYDITLVDTPAANTCADARRVSTVVGYSLVVTRRDQSFVEDVKTLIGQLEADHARIVGTVLNEG